MDGLRRTRVVLVGFGYWGRIVARTVLALPSMRLVGILEPAAGPAAADYCADRSLRFHPDWASVATSAGDVDAVLVCTPPHTHVAVAGDALALGKHVFCEKPLTLSPADSALLGGIAARAGLVLMPGYVYRFHPAVRKLGELVAAGSVGTPVGYEAVWAAPGPERTDVSALWDLAVHGLSIIEYVSGPGFVTASAVGMRRPGSRHVESAILDVEYRADLRARLFISWLGRAKVRHLTVHGTEGSLTLEDDEPSTVRLSRPTGVTSWSVRRGQPLAVQLAEFARRCGSPATAPAAAPSDIESVIATATVNMSTTGTMWHGLDLIRRGFAAAPPVPLRLINRRHESGW